MDEEYTTKEDDKQGFYVSPVGFAVWALVFVVCCMGTYAFGASETRRSVQSKWIHSVECENPKAKPKFLENGDLICVQYESVVLKNNGH